MSPSLRSLGTSAVGVVSVVLVWWFVTATELVNPRILIGPWQLLHRLPELDWNALFIHSAQSLKRVALGFVIGSIAGLAVGIWIARSRYARRALSIPLELLRPIPPLAWIPLAIIWFGIGDSSKVFVIALGCFFVMLTNTEKGILGLDPALVRQGRSYGLEGVALLRRVILPGILPELMVGVGVSLSLAFASLVAAEMLGANSGLGYMLMMGRVDGDYSLVLIAIITIALLAFVVDWAARRLLFPRSEAYDS